MGKSLKGETVYFGSQLEGTVHQDGKSRHEKPEAAGYIASTVRKQGGGAEMNDVFSSLFPLKKQNKASRQASKQTNKKTL